MYAQLTKKQTNYMEQSTSWEANSTLSYNKKLRLFYGARNFITVSIRDATGPNPESDESNPHPPTLFP
jgi:hypothetical protein